ncbi:unnamed protein product, partial [Mesorhabditis spiculigera]
MGLCKCPKRKVTNLFCFEHRVNVCEYCLVDAHPNCIVQSYLQWLQDSDYDPNCALCETPLLRSDDSRETIRLQCLHVYHWDCIDNWARKMPPNTAPAGYRCPFCREALFPAPEQQSPLIEKLRAQLKAANWARVGIGLPILPELDKHQPAAPPLKAEHGTSNNIPPTPTHHPIYSPPNRRPMQYSANYRTNSPATVLDVDDGFGSRTSEPDVTERKKYNGSYDYRGDAQPLLSQDRDADDASNKYKRRPVMQWLGGIWRARYGDAARASPPVGRGKRIFFILFLIVVAVLTLVHLMRTMSVERNQEANPIFDPMANPNIRIGDVPEVHSFN